MNSRQTPWPRRWLMTDERMGNELWEAIDRLPSGDGGIVVRHYSLDPGDRAELAKQIASFARSNGLMLGVARDVRLARSVGADLVHQPDVDFGLFSLAVHDEQEARRANSLGAALVFVSPIFQTRSHPTQAALGADRAAALARLAETPVIALGGMNEERFHLLDRSIFHGWAGIDAWLERGCD